MPMLWIQHCKSSRLMIAWSQIRSMARPGVTVPGVTRLHFKYEITYQLGWVQWPKLVFWGVYISLRDPSHLLKSFWLIENMYKTFLEYVHFLRILKLVKNLLRICIKTFWKYKTFLKYVHFLLLLLEGSWLSLSLFPSHFKGHYNSTSTQSFFMQVFLSF